MIERKRDARCADSEIVNTRIFDAARDTVFNAFADPTLLAKWWGPAQYQNAISQFDLRPQGTWLYVMHAPDGTDYPSESRFVAVDPPSRVVLEHIRPAHHFFLTMDYESIASDKTRLTWRMTFEPGMGDQVREFLSAANEQNFDRLAAVLSANHVGKAEVP